VSGGLAVLGTPTEAAIVREMLGSAAELLASHPRRTLERLGVAGRSVAPRHRLLRCIDDGAAQPTRRLGEQLRWHPRAARVLVEARVEKFLVGGP